MKKHLTWLAALAVLGLAGTANAKPVKLSKAELDKVVAGWQGAPGQFPAGNPAKAPGKSNTTGGGTSK
jgi:hypothetical protein